MPDTRCRKSEAIYSPGSSWGKKVHALTVCRNPHSDWRAWQLVLQHLSALFLLDVKHFSITLSTGMAENNTWNSWAERNLKEQKGQEEQRARWVCGFQLGRLVRGVHFCCVKQGCSGRQYRVIVHCWPVSSYAPQSEKKQILLSSRPPFSFTITANTCHDGQIMLICWSQTN